MALTTMVDGSGRIVIPKHLREEMKLDYGTFLVVEKEDDDSIRLRVVRVNSDPSENKVSDNNTENPQEDEESDTLKEFLESNS